MLSHVQAPMEISMISGTPGLMSSFHTHKELEINLLESGTMTYMFGASHAALTPGRLAVFWATIPHRVVHIDPETRFYCVNLSLSCFLGWQLSQDFTARLLRGEMIIEPDDSQREIDGLCFERWSNDLRKAGAELSAIVEAEVQARLRRLALRMTQAPAITLESVIPANRRMTAKVEQIARFIGEQYRFPISADDIGRAVNLHPKYAATLFKKHCGMTLGEYLTEQRLSQAKRLLATTENKVVDIAFESGFNSVSRFYEVFEQNCGQTPREYRAHLMEPPHAAPAPPSPDYTGCNVT